MWLLNHSAKGTRRPQAPRGVCVAQKLLGLQGLPKGTQWPLLRADGNEGRKMTGVTLIEGAGKSSGVSHLCERWQGLVGWEGPWPRQVASSRELSPEATP